jgi:hypothetical protein
MFFERNEGERIVSRVLLVHSVGRQGSISGQAASRKLNKGFKDLN